MANQNGIQITIKGFLPTGKSLEDQFSALSLVRGAQGDIEELATLVGKLEDFSFDTKIKTRRVGGEKAGEE